MIFWWHDAIRRRLGDYLSDDKMNSSGRDSSRGHL